MTDHLPDAERISDSQLNEILAYNDPGTASYIMALELKELRTRHNGIEFLFAWMRAPNPMLGMVSPEQMIRFGRGEALLNFINEAREDYEATQPTP